MSFQNGRISSRFLEKGSKSTKFLDMMEKVLPRNEMVQAINKVRSEKNQTGRPVIPTIKLLKIYCLQQWYNLADPAVEDAVYDRISFQKFLDIDIVNDQIPDETTVCRFRKLLNDNELQKIIFDLINQKLEKHGLSCTQGTIVDATIINAPTSTKNKKKTRDPEMHSTQKGKQYYFGMKTHIGVDKKNGLVHSITCTSAEVHDSQMMSKLLHGKEKEIYGDGGYADKRKLNSSIFSGVFWLVCRRAYRNQSLSQEDRNWNRFCSAIRSKVEWVFGVIKDLWGHRKVRYKGLHKNEMQRYMLCGLTNIYRMRKYLLS